MSESGDEFNERILEALREAGFDLNKGGDQYLFAADPRAQRVLELLIERGRAERQPETSPQQGQTLAKLSICAVSNPEKWEDTQQGSAHWFDFTFDGGDWDAVFFDVLEGRNDSGQYPLLFRIDDMYEDAIFREDEVSALMSECQDLLSRTSSARAAIGLGKLILACSYAAEAGLGLYLACD